MRFQITDDFLNEYSGTGLTIDLLVLESSSTRPSWPDALIYNPFESFKDDLYAIDERFVDGLVQGRVITWQERFWPLLSTFTVLGYLVPAVLSGTLAKKIKNLSTGIYHVWNFCNVFVWKHFYFLQIFYIAWLFRGYKRLFQRQGWWIQRWAFKFTILIGQLGSLSDWSIRKPLKGKRSGKKERAHEGLMATIWTWSLLMTSSDNSKSPSARLENLPEKTFVENFRKWAAEIWFNLIAVPLNKINQKLNQHIPAACSFFIV